MTNKPNADTKIAAATSRADGHKVKSAEKAAVREPVKSGEPKKA